MGDEPPDYIDWGNGRSGGSVLGCLGVAIGVIFMLTGGLCVFAGAGSAGSGQLLIGLVLILIGWLLMKSDR